MQKTYDLAPTEPLRGLHMRGRVTRRFLITYPVPPETLATAVPPARGSFPLQGLGVGVRVLRSYRWHATILGAGVAGDRLQLPYSPYSGAPPVPGWQTPR